MQQDAAQYLTHLLIDMENKHNPNLVSMIKHLPIKEDYLLAIKRILLTKEDSIRKANPHPIHEGFYAPLSAKDDEIMTGLHRIISMLGELQRVESDVPLGLRYGLFIRPNRTIKEEDKSES